MRNLPHIFNRVFNVPLALPPSRLEPLLAGLQAASQRRGSLLDEGEPTPRRANGYTVTPQGVAVLTLRGVLVKREGEITADSTELESYARISSRLRRATSDAGVRGILLDLDTPGGEVGGLFGLVDDIRAAGTIKPVWAIANDDALSAGYAIASAASRIWTTSVGGLGSVGVVAMHSDQSGFDAANGLSYTYIYAGERKIDGNPHEPLSDAAEASIQAEVTRIYGMFVSLVANQRGISADAVRATQAAVLSGPDAIDAGLADQLGTLPEAITALGDFAADVRRISMTDITSTGPIEAEAPTAVETTPPPNPVADALERAAEAPAAQVVQLELVRQATASVRRETAEIVGLCNIAKLPELAESYITKGTPVNAVRADLQRRQAEASELHAVETVVPTVASVTDPSRPSEMSKTLAERWARQMGRNQ